MKTLKMCLNWKVLAGLVAVGAGMYAIAPNLAVAALPFLLLAICPLSMMFMMKGMQGEGGKDGERTPETSEGLTREERLARLRTEQAGLADQIGALEDEPQAARNGNKR